MEVLIQRGTLLIMEERVVLDVSKPHQLSLQLAVLTLAECGFNASKDSIQVSFLFLLKIKI